MNRNSEAEELKYLQDHHAFIMTTDRKSLHTQIKSLVQQAQEVTLKELNQRRIALQKLIEYEDKIYEEEFANNVKSRLEEDIKERKDVLLKIKEESAKNEQEFLKSKRIQQYMNSCYEIREALRHKEMQEVKTIQLEQILEKERAIRASQELEKYWYDVQQKNLQVADERQQNEECLKRALIKHTTDTLKVQMEELQEKRDEIVQEKLRDKQDLDEHIEKVRLEEFDRKRQRVSAKANEYRQELLDMMDEKRKGLEREERERAETQVQIIADSQRLMAEEAEATVAKRRALRKATLDYIQYVKRLREIGEQQERMYDERINDLHRVDICTKANILLERQRKARIAEQCFAELRKQICEVSERRIREEAERRESKIIENRFAPEEITREQILAQRRKNREELDKQIAEMKRIQEAEEAKFKTDLGIASNDSDFCSVLAERYIREGIDYLEPHANWRILACPTKMYVRKPPASNVSEVLKGSGGCCFEPCGCIARIKPSCSSHDGAGDGSKPK